MFHDEIKRLFWSKGARPSLSGVLLKTGIQKSDQKPEQAGECSDSIQKSDQKPERAGDDGNGIRDSKETSESEFGKQVGEINLLVATLITTVTFAAAFTVPGGYKSEGVDEGLAILCKRFAFGVFLIANTLAFGLSTTSVFIHFFATTTITSADFHREVAQHTPIFTKWSIGALLAAFIAGTYIVVPLSLGITIAVILFCCFLISLFFPIAIK